ncbi:phage capsid protein [Croceibacterium mercuriale]|uniref:Phage capsid protein n=1 Tax=Croceibacterium mercuriale TaxID=1572751 RepID=A0A0B2BXF6_9SPHN|nr:phage major capsid protein [Croceibacterium mercuriale]KHL24545.1 phage capsid protein [Croceibacterium mercuriale]
MNPETEQDVLAASFDIVARQDRTDEAIAQLRTALDEAKARIARIGRAGVSRVALAAGGDRTVEVKGFVDGYLRQGRETELKGMNSLTGPEGGFAVPAEVDVAIAATVKAISPIRQVAQVVQVGSAGYRKLVSTGGAASGWVSELAPRPGTDTSSFKEINPPSGELYANPAASQTMLDDAAFDLESWLTGEIAVEFARAEGAAFVNGTGVDQPLGILRVPTSTKGDDMRPFGELQYLTSGADDGFDTGPDLKLVDMVHALRASLRQGACWLMNSRTLADIRKLKTADGAFIWQPGLSDGQPDRLLGYPVIEAEDMPDIDIGEFPIAFGNFQAGYLITERTATSILRDPFTNKPFVHFYATKRVGGQVLDTNAIKLLRIEA